MHAFQMMIDGMNAGWQRERAGSQMVLGDIIDELETMNPDQVIRGLGELGSYRGYYCDLAFEPDDCAKTAATLLEECKAAMGKVFTGYKGGDFQMGENTPLWVAPSGSTGYKLMALNPDGSLELSEDTY